jgi:hypothetical protein
VPLETQIPHKGKLLEHPILQYPQPQLKANTRHWDPSTSASFSLSMMSPLFEPRIRLLKAYVDDYPDFKTLVTWTYFLAQTMDENVLGTMPLAVNVLTFFLSYCNIPYYRKKPRIKRLQESSSDQNCNVDLNESTTTSERSETVEEFAEDSPSVTDEAAFPDIVHILAQCGNHMPHTHQVDVRMFRHPVKEVKVQQEFINVGPTSYRLFYEYIE